MSSSTARHRSPKPRCTPTLSASVKTNSTPGSERGERTLQGTDVPCRAVAETTKGLVHNEVIPEELLVSLTSTVCSDTGLMPSAHQRHCKGHSYRRPDPVWHHSLSRKKYQYFLEQPTSLSGAGRDISFLCDAAQRKTITLPPLADDSQNMTVSESLIPDEYHIVKNKGLRSLELYDDAFTVQLQDEEQKLRVFPSMKPSGRQEALQLMLVMDDMLEKAGVEQQSSELSQLSQIEGLLELVRTEQNIYNLVFHELIRQVSVGCAERGHLLAKLRQRYQSLLERIPRYLKSLHTEALAQRALDRQLTVQIHRIKTSIQQLSSELAKIKDHDAFVSQQAERAQHELDQALSQSQDNSEVVQRYHDLYELQRDRLNAELLHMSEERDFWRNFTQRLALKVVSAKDLQLVAQLHTSQETWHKTAENCSLYINTKDSEELKFLSGLAELWRVELRRFMSELKRRDRDQSQVLCGLQQDISKWRVFCSSQTENSVQKCPRATVEEIWADFKAWSETLLVQSEVFQGEAVLVHSEELERLRTMGDRWLGSALQLLHRHSAPDSAPSPQNQTFTQIQNLQAELHTRISHHITGENGVHRQLQSLSDAVASWFSTVTELKDQPHKALDLDTLKLEKSLELWQSLVEKILHLILSEVKAEDHTIEPVLYTDAEQVAHKVQAFVENLCSFIDSENQTVDRELAAVHTRRTRWMLDLLLLLIPDREDQREGQREGQREDHPSVPQLEEQASLLSQRVQRLSGYFTRTCQLIYEEQNLSNPSLQEEADTQVAECLQLQNECTDWVDTTRILLVGLKMPSLELQAAEDEDVTSQVTSQVTSLNVLNMLKENEAEDKQENEEELSRTEAEQRAPSGHHSPVLELISSDRSIVQKKLEENLVPLPTSEELVVAPVTEEAQRAFTELTTAGILQRELLASEEQVQRAQQRALEAEEALQEALLKIQELETGGRSPEEQTEQTPETQTEREEPEPPASSSAVTPVRVKKTPPPQAGSRKNRRR